MYSIHLELRLPKGSCVTLGEAEEGVSMPHFLR